MNGGRPAWEYLDLQSEHWPGWSPWPPELAEKEEPGHRKHIVWIGKGEHDLFMVTCPCGNRWIIRGPCPPPNWKLIKCGRKEAFRNG